MKPQIVTLSGVEFEIHVAAQRRGHNEALGDVAANLKRAAEVYRAQLSAMPKDATPEQWAEVTRALVGAFETIGDQFKAEATKAHADAVKHLTRACELKQRTEANVARLPWWRRKLAEWGLGHRRRLVLDSPNATPPR